MTSFMSGDRAEIVRIAFVASQVTRRNGLVVHPSPENSYGPEHLWGVSAECGLSIGRFSTRASAEAFAEEVSKALDWAQCPVDLEAANVWASRCGPEQRAAIIMAFEYARKIAQEPRLPWEGA